MENQEFNLRNFLYNNPLLESEDQEEKYIGGDEKYEYEKGKEAGEKDVKESALRKAIQNEIASILKEAEDEDVEVDEEEDVDVEVEDEVTIDDESEESEIEVDSELAGEDADTAGVLGLLTKAQDEAEALGDEKLMDQIGNTITYFTRAHVVKSTETRAVAENRLFTRRK